MSQIIGSEIDLAVRNRVIPDNEIIKQFQEGEIGCILDWEVRDTKTRELKEVGKKKAESFTEQFMEYLWVMMNGVSIFGQFLSKRNDAIEVGIGSGVRSGIIAGLVNTVVDGIVVGTGITAVNVTNYVMETLITHGVGGGQLQYSAVIYGAPAVDATTSQYTITRNFANASGGDVTVKEIGLYVNVPNFYVANTPNYFLWLHDNIAGGISVGNGQTLTVNYRPQCVI